MASLPLAKIWVELFATECLGFVHSFLDWRAVWSLKAITGTTFSQSLQAFAGSSQLLACISDLSILQHQFTELLDGLDPRRPSLPSKARANRLYRPNCRIHNQHIHRPPPSTNAASS